MLKVTFAQLLWAFLVQYGKWTLTAIAIGYAVDLLIGDPHGMWHPICFIGNRIAGLEKKLRSAFPKTEEGERHAGVWLVVLILIISAGIPFVILFVGYSLHPILGLILQSYMCYAIFATKSLRTESTKVYTALQTEGLEAGRKAVSMIVGRDTQNLTETGVVKATVETIAENTSDGVIAPLIYMVIWGPVLGFFYKGANTMDSMVGYKNDKYMHFGRAAALFDDVVNYIPSRLSAVFMILAANFCKLDGKNARRIWKRDRRNHASPNSAQTESVTAGALHVQLAGDAWYFGKLHKKPFIGDDDRPIEAEDIIRTNRLMYITSGISLVILFLIRALLVSGIILLVM